MIPVIRRYTSVVGTIQQVIITPFIKVEGQKDPIACSDNTIEIDADEIYEC